MSDAGPDAATRLPAPILPIETQRLSLRPFEAADFAAYAAYRTRDDVYRYMHSKPLSGEILQQKFMACLDRSFAQDGDIFRLAVTRRDDDKIMGDVSLTLASTTSKQAEIGYVFHPDFGGRGYASEAVAALIQTGFESFAFHRIFARLDPDNRGSVGIVERLGFRREAHLLQNDLIDGEWRDEFIYALLANEWQARRNLA